MEGILKFKESFEEFYSDWGNYLNALGKFLTALFLFWQINGRLGYFEALESVFLVLLMALFCSFLPANLTVVLASAMVLLHLYALSPAALAVGGGILILLLMVYFSFAGNQGYALILTPVALMLHIPCSVPLIFGLMGKPAAGIAIAAGTVICYAVTATAEVFQGGGADLTLAMARTADSEKILDSIKQAMDAVLQEQEMILMLIVLLSVFFVVYFTRRMTMKYAWKIAIGAGTAIYVILMLAGSFMLTMRTSLVWVLAGTVISLLIAAALEILFFQLDYTKTENLQFEDEEYYYYVRAVPKKHSHRKKKPDRKGCEESAGNKIICP